MKPATFHDNPSAHRFEALVDGNVAAYAEYNTLKNGLLFTHTEVMPQYEGLGLGSQLARFALEAVRDRGLHAIPVCQFIAGYIRRHPEYLDLLSDESRRAFRV
ncbi:MAG TPA: GNAT family N-acetyltransferase [Ramlibacter sp.]|nr:GNAT family N-acetyltransferase [Ramlibacter sp.]